MKQYTSCFIGVPLFDKFQKEFEKLLGNVAKLYPNWQIVFPKTPHITVYYLNKQSQFALFEIEKIIQTKISILKNLVLSINGFDYFWKDDLREGIIFLETVYPPAFVDFKSQLANKLSRYYSADNNLPFHPHMTVARVNDLSSVGSLKNCVLELGNKTGKINWEFPITEIVIYGADSKKQPQYQEKLISIPTK